MQLRALTDGSVSGTDTVKVQNRLIGGVLITADGTNDATVVLRRNDASGKQIFKFVTKSPQMVVAPIGTEGAETVYYSVSGTGAAAQIYEWVE
jgi:hypothetical protein